MILGWTVGAIVALIGFIAIEGTSETPKLTLLITAGYEILFAFAITTLIIHGALYRRNVFHPGTSPSHFCRESILTALSGIENKSKYIVGWHLADIQYRIMENAKEQMHEVSIYRKALALIAISLITGAILMAALLIYL